MEKHKKKRSGKEKLGQNELKHDTNYDFEKCLTKTPSKTTTKLSDD